MLTKIMVVCVALSILVIPIMALKVLLDSDKEV